MPAVGKVFRRRWEVLTDDLVDLAILRRRCVSRCEPRTERWREGLLDGLEGAANSRRAAEAGAGAQDPAAIPSD
jgi:hypothetical protein